MACRYQKLMFPCKCLDDYEKLSHIGPVIYENFSSSIKCTITRNEYEQFLKLFRENDCNQRTGGSSEKILTTASEKILRKNVQLSLKDIFCV